MDVSWSMIAIPLAMMVLIGFALRVFSRLFLVSACARTVRLFSGVPWLPMHTYPERYDGERFSATTSGGHLLHGSCFTHSNTTGERKGVVVFCHELNGTRYGVTPYIDSIRQAGFDLYTFDFHGHGESGGNRIIHAMPMITTTDLEDVHAVIDLIVARVGTDCPIGLFGMGKGAMTALCAAAKDERISSVVLDSPPPEGRLFEKNCWDALARSTRSLVATKSPRYMLLLAKAVLYTLVCPFRILHDAWRRRVLGYWCGCRFVNATPLVRSVSQPVLIVHGNGDSFVRTDQVHAFRNRLRVKPRVWFVSRHARRQLTAAVHEDCCRAVTDFLAEQDACR